MWADTIPGTNIYVDGFNLYYGAVKSTPYKWLDVAGLCQRILPKITINRVRYFTAMVDGSRDPSAPQRQQIYLRALATIPNLTIHRGFFLTKPTWMPVETPPPKVIRVIKTEEKGSDVNLATYLMLDAFRGDFDQAIVVSNDSDLAEPIRIVQAELGLAVGVFNPHKRPAYEITKVARFMRNIHVTTVANSQFPATLTDARGTFSKPASW
ncbi:MAG TPA: NYN domain-containing protein [Xanthomonadales bacterium]|nr:NYN domain-containing protein [Xanthomonadales bacterium]